MRHYATVDGTLYDAILNRCVEPGAACMNQTMAADAHANHTMGKKPALLAQSASTEICITPTTSVKKTTNAKPN